MKKTLTTTKQIVLGLGVAFLAVAFSSFTNGKKHLAAGDYQFYNTSGTIHDTNPAHYVYRNDDELCSNTGTVCKETWNIGSSTPTPADGTLLSAYSTKVYQGDVQPGAYTGGN